jgi:hypothetical protein
VNETYLKQGIPRLPQPPVTKSWPDLLIYRISRPLPACLELPLRILQKSSLCQREQPGTGDLARTPGRGTPTDRATSRMGGNEPMRRGRSRGTDWRQDTSIPLRVPGCAIKTKLNNQPMKRKRRFTRCHGVRQNHKELRKLILLEAAVVSC